jgi:hypothetical protein
MSLITRTAKGEKLTIEEMDGNLTYLEANGFVDGEYRFQSDDTDNTINASGDITFSRNYIGTGGVIAETLAFEPTSSFSLGNQPAPGTYSIGTVTDGDGSGLKVEVTVELVMAENVITGVTVVDGGTGYAEGDTITISTKQLGSISSADITYTLTADDVDADARNEVSISTTGVYIQNLPTEDPGKAGFLWVDTENDNVLKVSQG